MKVLDTELDTKPTQKKVRQMVELRIQNLQCFRELQTFNDTGKWYYHHPLTKGQSEYQQLLDLRYNNPQEFLRQSSATELNIRRYTSFLKSKTRLDRRKADKLNLERHKDRAKIFKTILQDETKKD